MNNFVMVMAGLGNVATGMALLGIILVLFSIYYRFKAFHSSVDRLIAQREHHHDEMLIALGRINVTLTAMAHKQEAAGDTVDDDQRTA